MIPILLRSQTVFDSLAQQQSMGWFIEQEVGAIFECWQNVFPLVRYKQAPYTPSVWDSSQPGTNPLLSPCTGFSAPSTQTYCTQTWTKIPFAERGRSRNSPNRTSPATNNS